MDWTEWLFDTHDVKYTKVTTADLQAGNLASRFDVLVLPDGLGGGRGGGGGGGGGGGAVADAADAAVVGAAAAPNDATHAVDEFVRGGGTVLAWGNGAASIAQALQLPVQNTTAGLSRKEYFTGTSIMQVSVDAAHPVMAGMPERADVTVNQPPAFTTTDGFDGAVIAKYPADASPLRSGFLTPGGDKFLQGYRGGARREAWQRTRRPVRVQSELARSADGLVPDDLQHAVLRKRDRRSSEGNAGLLDSAAGTRADRYNRGRRARSSARTETLTAAGP